MYARDTFCSWCGARYRDGQPWPRACAACSNVTFRNPAPVAVMLLPVDDGLLVIRRGIQPGLGKLALPGGYMNLGETWQQAAARELEEETGVSVPASEVELFRVQTAVEANVVILFGVTRRARASSDLPAFAPTDETTEASVISRPAELAFSTHTAVARDWFAERGHGRA